jgi:superfamily II DNA or RNA helicase
MLNSKTTAEKSATPSAPEESTSIVSSSSSAISSLKFPFKLTKDQLEAVDAWVSNGYKGSIIYSTGTGKTEIAFECAKRASAEAIVHPKDNNILFHHNSNDDAINSNSFNILFLVPRIILVEQNINRLIKYGISQYRIGAYFGERKEMREITISTYQSVINDLNLIYHSNMIVFDEVHLISDTATTLRKIFDAVIAATTHSQKKPLLLGLTATIDEQDPKYNTILSLLPPVKKYMIKDAVKDKRLAQPVVIPIKVNLTHNEKKIYDECSAKIRNISEFLNTSDPKSLSSLLRKGGHTAGLVRAWFANVKNRKNLINCAENKLLAAVGIIATKHPSERIMVFSETIESIQKLKEMLQNKGIESMMIDSKLKSKERQKILSEWGKEFFPLLSVHTLEIGYDVPEVRVAIILATTSNMNQIVQRIGRIVRKTEGKDTALIYTIYLSHTHDVNTLEMIRQATDLDKGRQGKSKRKQAARAIAVFGTNGSLDKYIF